MTIKSYSSEVAFCKVRETQELDRSAIRLITLYVESGFNLTSNSGSMHIWWKQEVSLPPSLIERERTEIPHEEVETDVSLSYYDYKEIDPPNLPNTRRSLLSDFSLPKACMT
ncbi:hypothetical protein TNIN_375951 [Trichonephila inaurata madagascariensis]|uniref:Uncharacterized protein n=1 Tax=Trichonephila inaurata madagascariensis TaxID=2747483 RepID=A0A8X7BUJ4_9ARAC|nr:hypothetical protein TNIN_375951 [Trichonephila inaurata madagascariensis]